MSVTVVVLSLLASASSLNTKWQPPNCEELGPGQVCRKLYEHPQGSTFVTPCPVDGMTDPDGCSALQGNKTDAEKCPQISCSESQGILFKLVCGGNCCPTCWAPDHVLAMDRHTTIVSPYVVPAAPQAPTTCGGVKCFKPMCAGGLKPGHVQGNCCYSCTPTR